MNYQLAFQKLLVSTACSHWNGYNKRRLDFADGRLPSSNPVNFYFYAEPSPAEGEFDIKIRFRRATDVDFSEIDFFDGLVSGDQHGVPLITWVKDIVDENSLSEMAKDLYKIAPIPKHVPVWDMSDEFAAA